MRKLREQVALANEMLGEDMQNLLYFGYSRKSQKSAFNALRRDFQKRTNKNLCEVVDRALERNLELIKDLDMQGDSKAPRVEIFRGITYEYLKAMSSGKATE